VSATSAANQRPELGRPGRVERPSEGGRASISALVLTKNEELNLEECLKSLADWCEEIHVVDSYSTDRTVEIAERYGARVTQHVFEGHARQRSWALQTLPIRSEWVIALDADQRVTAELREELLEAVSQAPEGVAGFYVKRRQVFRGRWIRHGGYYPKYMLKVFRRHAARFDENEFDDRVYVDGRTAKLRNDIIEANQKEWSISFFIEKHNHYASVVAAEELDRKEGRSPYFLKPALFGTPDQRTLWLKQRWMSLPLFVRPLLLFGYRYFLRLGFLDGKEGFLFHVLQSFWFRLLVDVRIEEMRNKDQRP
jgi:glycosyltransferase involved in cell wall biosynthesis